VPRWLKITLAVIAGLIVLLLLNAVVVSNATKDAYVRDNGARLVDTSNGTLQVLEQDNQRIRPPQTARPGNPIVLIHCYTCSMNWWGDLAPALERDHRVIRVDLLGHGGSGKPSAGYAIDDQASAVAEALSKIGVVDATVVGHSLGGSVAAALAEQSPRLASRVVIIDQAPEDGFEQEPLAQQLSYWPVVGQTLDRLMRISPKSVVRDQYDQAFAPGYDIPSGFDNPDQPVDDLRAMTYTAYKDTVDEEQNFVDEQPLDERLAATQVPAMVIFGAEDQIYDDVDGALAAYDDVPGVRTAKIRGAGHSPNVEKPVQTARLIFEFAADADDASIEHPPRNVGRKPQGGGGNSN
jgi:pimeloyl-ACP methyl ester carboxylesterase